MHPPYPVIFTLVTRQSSSHQFGFQLLPVVNVSFVTLPETYLSKLRGVNQTCIVFCPNNVDSLPELMSTNCPNGGGGNCSPDTPSRACYVLRYDIAAALRRLKTAYTRWCILPNQMSSQSLKHFLLAHCPAIAQTLNIISPHPHLIVWS